MDGKSRYAGILSAMLVLFTSQAAAGQDKHLGLTFAPQPLPSAAWPRACTVAANISNDADLMYLYGFSVGCQHGSKRAGFLWSFGINPGHLQVEGASDRFGFIGYLDLGARISIFTLETKSRILPNVYGLSMALKSTTNGGVFEENFETYHTGLSAGLQFDVVWTDLFSLFSLQLQSFFEVLPILWGGYPDEGYLEFAPIRVGGALLIRWKRSRAWFLLAGSTVIHTSDTAGQPEGWMFSGGISCCSP